MQKKQSKNSYAFKDNRMLQKTWCAKLYRTATETPAKSAITLPIKS